jgi:hypothetical protein
MTKNYIKKNISNPLSPKPETLRFLLDYSKSLKVVKTKTNYTIELYLN